MPAFVFSRDDYDLHRVYIATDKDCVNIVHVGSIVGGTVYAPRTTGPLDLATEKWDRTHSFLIDGSEGKTLRSDGEAVTLERGSARGGLVGGQLQARRLDLAGRGGRRPARRSTCGTATGRPAGTTGRSSRSSGR